MANTGKTPGGGRRDAQDTHDLGDIAQTSSVWRGGGKQILHLHSWCAASALFFALLSLHFRQRRLCYNAAVARFFCSTASRVIF